jgi:hypothetical protein
MSLNGLNNGFDYTSSLFLVLWIEVHLFSKFDSARVSCGVAALLILASLPFYLILEEPKKSSLRADGSSQTLSQFAGPH